ncbi:DUF1853 family protein [Emcibacter sp.]|uniref:DUF1853 family protein n=1 Tax=Emcibacter sp. TaxID=1979954 RepID=UPI003A9378A6
MKKYLYDLKWLLKSPPLIDSPMPDWLPALADRLLADGISDQPKDLARTWALGPYFENIFATFLQQDRNITGLHRNIQVREQGLTKGEFDFLFQRNGQSFHVETTVKLYLGTGNCQQAGEWIGPGGRDRLDLKLAKILERQLLLAHTDAGRETIERLGYDMPQAFVFSRGYLFHPLQNWKSGNFIVPDRVNPHHRKGWWVHRKNMKEQLDRASFWTILTKPFWLDFRTGLEEENIHEPQEMYARLSGKDRRKDKPVLLAALEQDQGQWRELHRGFIVPDNWPRTDNNL